MDQRIQVEISRQTFFFIANFFSFVQLIFHQENVTSILVSNPQNCDHEAHIKSLKNWARAICHTINHSKFPNKKKFICPHPHGTQPHHYSSSLQPKKEVIVFAWLKLVRYVCLHQIINFLLTKVAFSTPKTRTIPYILYWHIVVNVQPSLWRFLIRFKEGFLAKYEIHSTNEIFTLFYMVL